VTHAPVEEFTKTRARRIALAAQGFADRRPSMPDARSLARVVNRVALFQIDSVNVVTRAQYMPLFSRLGPYSTGLLDRAYGRAPRRMFEYWAHEASLVRVDLYPALRFRMARADQFAWGGMLRLARDRPDLVSWVLAEVSDNGPLTSREIQSDVSRRRDGWGWNWSDVKTAMEWLFFCGEVTSVKRNSAFERVFDLPDRVLPPAVLQAPTPDDAAAHRQLIMVAAKAHGIGTEQCLRDYFRLGPEESRAAIRDLAGAGELLPVRIKGWHRQAYLHPEARIPRSVRARALISPFDSLVFERTRTEALFGFRYRIEIYVPPGKRVHGYYVLPFLLGDKLVARVDLKADRRVGLLRVQSAHAEPEAPSNTAEELARELWVLAGWLGLTGVSVTGLGDLGPALARAAHLVCADVPLP
jgi:uncharacterized protein YcaQ